MQPPDHGSFRPTPAAREGKRPSPATRFQKDDARSPRAGANAPRRAGERIPTTRPRTEDDSAPFPRRLPPCPFPPLKPRSFSGGAARGSGQRGGRTAARGRENRGPSVFRSRKTVFSSVHRWEGSCRRAPFPRGRSFREYASRRPSRPPGDDPQQNRATGMDPSRGFPQVLPYRLKNDRPAAPPLFPASRCRTHAGASPRQDAASGR